jgi:hypothetical protein
MACKLLDIYEGTVHAALLAQVLSSLAVDRRERWHSDPFRVCYI